MDIRRIRKSFSAVGWAFTALLLIGQGAGAALMVALYSWLPSLADSAWATWLVTDIGLYLLGFPVFLLILRRVPGQKARERREFSPLMVLALLAICLSALYLSNYVTLALTQILSILRGGELVNPVSDMVLGSALLPNLLFGVVVAPVMEELIFRGILLDKLRPWGDRLCILASGLFFALFHGNLFQLFYAFCLGAIFAYIALRSGGIRYTILLHAIVNLVGMVVAPAVAASGNMAALVLMGLCVLAVIAAGVTLVILLRGRIVLWSGSAPFPERRKAAFLLFNPGTAVYVLLCGALVALITLL